MRTDLIVLRVVLRVLRAAVLAVALTAVLLLAVGHALGWSALVVRSGSMEPAVPVGSLVLARPVHPGDVRLGDVIAAPRRIGGGQVLVLHRVVALTERDGRLQAQLRGDANPVPDPEPAVLAGTVTRSVVVLPGAGYGVAATRMALTPSRLLLTVLGVLALALIWRRPSAGGRHHRGGINARVSGGRVEYAGRVRQSLLLRGPR